MKRSVSVLAAAVLTLGIALPVAATSVYPTSHGTWSAYPGQSSSYGAAVQQPINADGSSNFKANGKTVIPVKFALSQGTGAFAFESIYSDNTTPNDYGNPPGGRCYTGSGVDHYNDCSFLDWQSSTPLTFAQLASLTAVYSFTDGDCAGGSLRWTVTLNDGGTSRNLDVHYQPGTGGIGLQNCAAGTSGANLIQSSDNIFVTQEFNGTHSFPSPYNNYYTDVVAQLGSLPVVDVALIVDSGWGANGDQVVALTSATVGVANATPYTETFTPLPASTLSNVCPTAEATFSISKVDGLPSGEVNEPLSIQPQDSNKIFRIVDCKYMYNLATSSLSGVGTYTVFATIGSTKFTVGTFDLK
jgi:hypothetical protein